MARLLLFLFFTSVNVCTAQNNSSFFKTIPNNLDWAEDWVKLMYSEDPNVKEVEYLYDQFYKDHPFEKNIHTQNYKHWMSNIYHQINVDGKIRPLSKEEYQAKIKAVKNQKNTSNKSGSSWRAIGPFNTLNESEQGNFSVSWQANVYCFDQSATNPEVLFAGSESGGIFKSTDKGLHWEYCSQDIPAVTVTDIKIAPSNPYLIYACANDILYKSIDQGVTWQDIHSLSANAFQITVHPDDPNICYLVGSFGLQKTIDGGQTWIELLNSNCWDIKLKPNDPSTVYVLQSNNSKTQCQFLKSIDEGESFTNIENGWFAPSGTSPIDQGGRIAVTKANPSYVYVGLLGEGKTGDNGWIGIYKSEDSGDSWINPNLPDGGPYNNDDHQNLATINRDGTGFHQGFYNFAIEASDLDPEKIWLGCLALSQSNDGGQSWTRIGSYNAQNDIGWIHPDIQDLHVSNEDIWVCTDGGINYSNDELQSHESRINGLYGSNYWGFGQGWNQDVMVGGRYHNGNSGYYETYGLGNSLRLGGAEAATGYVNPLKERKAYFSDISTKIVPEYIDGPTTALSPLGLYPNETYSLSYSSELVFDPRYADHIIMGKDNKIWKSINEGGQFEAIYEFQNARILEIEQSRSNPDALYCVSQLGTGYWDDCAIFKSTDGGYTWESTSSVPTNDTWRMEISINPENENELWVVALNAFSSQLVFNTMDGGATWENKSSEVLNNHYPSDIKFQAGTDQLVYLSTDLGLFYWSKNEEEWIDCSEGLPLVNRSMEIEPFYRDSKIRMATRGRGIYEADMVEKSKPIAQPMTTSDVVYCSRDTVQFDCYSVLDHDGASWNWSFDPEPIYLSDANARNPKVVFGQEGSYDVSLEVIDGLGNSSTKTVSEMVRLENRCAVDTFPGSVLLCQQNGDFVSTPDLELFTNEMTFTAWVKPDGVQGEYTGIVMNNGDAGGLNFRPNMELGYHWPGGAWWWSSGLYVPTDEWSYVAMVAKPDGVTVYLNGVGVTHTTSLEEIDISSLLIGSYKAWDGRNFKGLIDEVCIWSRALSQDEIRELRHLTKDGITDQDFLAYYQFNESSIPRVLDKVGDKHASLNGNARIENTVKVPVANGTSERKTITEAGVHSFPLTGVSMELSNDGLLPDGELVVSRLHSTPYPNSFTGPGTNSYWIINNYGNDVYGPIKNFDLEPVSSLSNSFLENEEIGQLYNRVDNDDIDNWEIRCNSIGVENSFVLFGENCVESASGQFYVVSEDPNVEIITSTKEQSEVAEVFIYPNPVVQNGQVHIDNPSNEILRLKLFSTEGRLVYEQIIYTDSFKVPSEVKNGIYFFQLETNKYIKTGKLIIQ